MLSLVRTLPRLPSLSLRLLARLATARGISRSRARLAVLDDRLLADIGVTRHEAEAEAERPAWDAPPHWMQR